MSDETSVAHLIFAAAILATLLSVVVGLWWEARPVKKDDDPYREPWS